MTEIDPEDVGRGQEPGADVGDDGDIPDNPLIGGPASDDPLETEVPGRVLGREVDPEGSEAGLGGTEGDLGAGGDLGGDFGGLDEEGDEPTPA